MQDIPRRGAGSRLYLDWNATAPLDPAAGAAAVAAMALGNASSVHAEGRAARAVVERTRAALAARFGVAPEGVTFTSGGTEANAFALAPVPGQERLVVSAAEHPAVLAGGRFAAVETVPVDGRGVVALEALERTLRDGPPALVSVMAANNETGVVQPLVEVAALVRAWGGVLHTDAVQAFGRIPDPVADMVTLSGHKIGAPAGVGALVRRGGIEVPPLIRGGGQERGRRGGTENVAAIAGFGAVLAGAVPAAWAATAAARAAFERDLLDTVPGVTIWGQGAERLPNTTLFSVPMPAELTLIALDLAGFAVSSGSACSSGKVGRSHVLAAMGVPPAQSAGAIRVSVGPDGAADLYGRFLVALARVVVQKGTADYRI